ncbi:MULTISPECIES: helix-turn-helix domain-containing protein [unclassified Amycolatopsis]|uniref:AraC-like ligand-binding domain-containing protein n=1 Tax=unclassified Amycolatopsis TaxID=2618356 RepID=UPI002874C8E6|nr:MULTISPECIES: helix-turn-helix domain-containing protein [unclassified Amycolatopsis]MDS0134525.1 helix-turn-helix domain-containing protein [Amycolatopsis sp. 505]MDS0147873.1 helix-turn-helix domain-containing protein [Amycolatopsis sp. CM201R]
MTSFASLPEQFTGLAPRPITLTSWAAAVRRSVLSIEFDCDRPEQFTGRVRDRHLHGVSFVDMASGRHAAHRDHRTIRPADAGFYVLTLQLAGEIRIAQDGRAALLKPGLFALYDSGKPATLTVGDGYRSTCIRFPKSAITSRPGDPLAEITATPFACAPGLTDTVWSTVLSVNRNLEALGPHGPTAVRSLMTLVGTMLRSELGPRVPARPPHEELLERILAHIDGHLADPGLDPGRIAAAHFLSPRALHSLFERTGTTVSRCIRDRRIEHCRLDLADPALAHVPASAIGARWGFRGASHFGSVFKRANGLAPAEFRRRVLEGGPLGVS